MVYYNEEHTFNKPTSGIVTLTVCKDTGCISTASCTNTYSEIFTSDNIPATCEGHGSQKICKETKKLANNYCPDVEVQSYGGNLPKEQLGLWKTVGTGSKVGNEQIKDVCDVHKKPEEKPPVENNTVNNNTTNTNSTNTTNNNTTNNNNIANNNATNNNTSNSSGGNNTSTNTSAGNDNVVE